MDDFQANIEKLLLLHAEVSPEVQVTPEQMARDFPIFVRGLASTVVDVQEQSKYVGNLSNQVNILAQVVNMKLIDMWKRISDLEESIMKHDQILADLMAIVFAPKPPN